MLLKKSFFLSVCQIEADSTTQPLQVSIGPWKWNSRSCGTKSCVVCVITWQHDQCFLLEVVWRVREGFLGFIAFGFFPIS